MAGSPNTASRVAGIDRQEMGRPLPSNPVKAMGIEFPNALGLSAGFDRTGALVPVLAGVGFGHVEVGTVTAPTAAAAIVEPARSGPRIGVNIGSARLGLDAHVIADYCARYRDVASSADYVVANLSSPYADRDGNSRQVDLLIRRLTEVRDALFRNCGFYVPLLVKVEGGVRGSPLPTAISLAKSCGLDGVVLVSSCTRRIAAVCEYLDGLALISVSGIATLEDAEARIAAGAALVQIYTAFVRGGPQSVRAILGSDCGAGCSGQ